MNGHKSGLWVLFLALRTWLSRCLGLLGPVPGGHGALDPWLESLVWASVRLLDDEGGTLGYALDL